MKIVISDIELMRSPNLKNDLHSLLLNNNYFVSNKYNFDVCETTIEYDFVDSYEEVDL